MEKNDYSAQKYALKKRLYNAKIALYSRK